MHVLLLSYHVYPDSTSEGLQVAKTARAIADAGHLVTLVTSTVNRLDGTVVTPSSGFLHGIQTHRVSPCYRHVPRWATLLAGLADRRNLPNARARWYRRLGRIPQFVFGCTPHQLAWVQAARDVVLRMITSSPQREFDVMHTRLNPFLSHYVALEVLKRAPGIPWCAHFSDPWPGHLYPPPYKEDLSPHPWLQGRLERLFDRMLDAAHSYTFPSERLMNWMLAGTRSRYRSKAHVVLQIGYEDGARLSQAESSRGFAVVHAGNLMKQRDVGPFLDAVRALLTRMPEARPHLRLEFVGPRGRDNDTKLQGAEDLADLISVRDCMAFEETWQWMKSAAVLLLVEADLCEGIFFPAKFADYLSARRPILALSPPVGTVADMIGDGSGLRVSLRDTQAIAEALGRLYTAWRCGQLDRFCPPDCIVSQVMPDAIVPRYERAFEMAIRNAKGGDGGS